MLTLFNESWQEHWRGFGTDEQELGAVFTKPEVVRLILDLAGYVPQDVRLAEMRLLEPSCGDGAFLKEIVARLIESEVTCETANGWNDEILLTAIRAVDVDEISLRKARSSVHSQLVAAGCPEGRATELTGAWMAHADFLLADWSSPFDFVIGNPPYVRIEAIPKPLLREYRNFFSTLTNRADLYVAFVEKGLQLLSPDGVLAYICANRFAKNQYGGSLRALISRRYHVRHYLNLEHTQPFETEVSAYPAILVVDRKIGATTTAATMEDLSCETLDAVRREARGEEGYARLSEFRAWYPDGGPWVATSRADSISWECLTKTHPLLEDSAPGTKVGIGVATGADKVFVLPQRRDDIEISRQLPLALARDVYNDGICWSGHYLIDPFAGEDGSGLVDLRAYPGLASYLETRRDRLERRHVARRRPQSWFRTIDRIWPSLQSRPKLLIPDIQSQTTIGFDPGSYYPHHNLYWITSATWDLRALKTLLRSTLVLDQVKAYSVQMRGGSLRFQAQTLRRIRIPLLSSLPTTLVHQLAERTDSSDQEAIDAVAAEAFSHT